MSVTLPQSAPALRCSLHPTSPLPHAGSGCIPPSLSLPCSTSAEPSVPVSLGSYWKSKPASSHPIPLPAPRRREGASSTSPSPLPFPCCVIPRLPGVPPCPRGCGGTPMPGDRGGLLKDTHMEERLSWGDVPRQPKLQSSRSGSGWGEGQRGTAFISVQPSQVPGFCHPREASAGPR